MAISIAEVCSIVVIGGHDGTRKSSHEYRGAPEAASSQWEGLWCQLQRRLCR